MITDTFLFFEFLQLLLMLFCLFELVTIFFLLCTFIVVISCFGMLLLLCLRLNFSKFSRIFVTEMSSLLFVNVENWLDETMSWSEIFITWSSACLSVILFFLKPLLLLFLCSFSYVLKIVLVFNQRLNNWSFFFRFHDENDESVLKVGWYIENFVRGIWYWCLTDISIWYWRITIYSNTNDLIGVISVFKTLICSLMDLKSFSHGQVVTAVVGLLLRWGYFRAIIKNEIRIFAIWGLIFYISFLD